MTSSCTDGDVEGTVAGIRGRRPRRQVTDMVTGQGGDVRGDCAGGDVGCDVMGGKRFCGAPLMDNSGFGGEGSATAQRLTRGGRYGGNTAHLPDANLRVARRWDGPTNR